MHEMTLYFIIKIHCHNIILNTNGLAYLIKDGNIYLPYANAYGYRVDEATRLINQFVNNTNLWDKLNDSDKRECKSCGELGTHLNTMFHLDNRSRKTRVTMKVYESDKYKYNNRAKSWFSITATYVSTEE